MKWNRNTWRDGYKPIVRMMSRERTRMITDGGPLMMAADILSEKLPLCSC